MNSNVISHEFIHIRPCHVPFELLCVLERRILLLRCGEVIPGADILAQSESWDKT